jgi:hypothetical protein
MGKNFAGLKTFSRKRRRVGVGHWQETFSREGVGEGVGGALFFIQGCGVRFVREGILRRS